MNGKDTFNIMKKAELFPREYLGMFTRLIIGRYGSDIRSEWAIQSHYGFGHLTFGELFYAPNELTREEINSLMRITGMTLSFCLLKCFKILIKEMFQNFNKLFTIGDFHC